MRRRELLQAMVSHEPRGFTVELVDVHCLQDAHQLHDREARDHQQGDRPHRLQAFYKSAAFTCQ